MTTKGRKYFSGNTLDNALLQAARHHGLRPEEVSYRQIEKRHGFLKARKGVLIEVDPDAPQRSVEEKEPVAEGPKGVETPVEPPASTAEEPMPADLAADDLEPEVSEEPVAEVRAEERPGPGRPTLRDEESSANIEELIEAAQRGLDDLLSFAKLDLEYEVSAGEGQLEIELHGADRSRLLEDRGNLILSIQHILPRLVRGYAGRSIPCHVDSENFHETRQVELERLAEEAAEEVRRRQRPRTLPPMNPAERRIIHVTLADEKEITTESQGRGFFKRVTISPAMRRPRGFDRYNR